jgi:short-subunit dehydrogenase
MLQKAEEAHIVNVSSINGFWATSGPSTPFTAYCAAKFAVRGFTEALLTDLAVNAPHIKCSVVMPGHVGTQIRANSRKVVAGVESDSLTPGEIGRMRERLNRTGQNEADLTDEDLRAMIEDEARLVVKTAPTSAEEAARIMLDGVRANRWRILVGEDAELVDRQVRATPEEAYTTEFFDRYGTAIGRKGRSGSYLHRIWALRRLIIVCSHDFRLDSGP